MLARPEPGTKEHILLWLASKNPEEIYFWDDSNNCACGQYAREYLDHKRDWMRVMRYTDPIFMLNLLAQDCRTFGALYEKAREHWDKQPVPVVPPWNLLRRIDVPLMRSSGVVSMSCVV